MKHTRKNRQMKKRKSRNNYWGGAGNGVAGNGVAAPAVVGVGNGAVGVGNGAVKTEIERLTKEAREARIAATAAKAASDADPTNQQLMDESTAAESRAVAAESLLASSTPTPMNESQDGGRYRRKSHRNKNRRSRRQHSRRQHSRRQHSRRR